MMTSLLQRSLAVLFLIAGLASAPAGALTLADLDAGAIFQSAGGDFEFSFDPGSIQLLGDLPVDLSDYVVLALADGFQVVGPLGVADGGFGALIMSYAVTALTGVLGEATLSSAGVALGSGALAFAGMDVGGVGLANAFAGSGLDKPTDTGSLAGLPGADVTTTVQLLALAPSQAAAIAMFDQTFANLPEPGSLLLLSLGMLGLAVLGRPDRSLRTGGPADLQSAGRPPIVGPGA